MLLAELPFVDVPFTQVLAGAGIATCIAIALSALFVFATKRRSSRRTGRNILSRSVYALFLVMILVLAISSFGAIIRFGHMSGYALLAHIAAAGAFVFLLLAIAYLYLPRGLDTDDEFGTADHRWWLARWSAWLLVASSIVATGTMFLSMLPVLATEGLLQVAQLHRYSGLVVVIAAVFHFYSLCCTKFGLR